MFLTCRPYAFSNKNFAFIQFKSFSCIKKHSSEKARSIDLSLYLVTERTCISNEEEFLHKVKQAFRGGVSCLQLRDRNEDLRASILTAYRLKKLMVDRKIPIIINNRVDIALAVGADGVHLGQNDFPVHEARQLLGKKTIIGLTVETLKDVHVAEKLDVDYLGVQIFPSKNTKPNSPIVWGLEGLKKIKAISRHRIVAIGGIDLTNLQSVCSILEIGKNRDGVAMVGDLWRADHPYVVAKKIRSYIDSKTCIDFNQKTTRGK